MTFWQKTVLVLIAVAGFFIWHGVFLLAPDTVRVSILDVGQGDAIFIEAPSGVQVLIDGGSGQAVLSQLAKRIPGYDTSLDLVIATHTDLDHLGGLVEVLKRYDVERVIENGFEADSAVYHEWETVLGEKRTLRAQAKAGDRITFGKGVYLDILGPTLEDFDPLPQGANEVMIVARLVVHEVEFLFTGDLEREDEIRLSSSGANLASDVLKIAHHGSRTSSSALFLKKVIPRYAVISVGARNRYGHPHKEILDRIGEEKIPLLRTDLDGTVSFLTDGASLVVETSR